MLFRATVLATAAIAASVIGVPSAAHAGPDGSDCPWGFYRAASGDWVPDPKRDQQIGRPPRSAEMATIHTANTRTRVAPATATVG